MSNDMIGIVPFPSRRQFLWNLGGGVAGLALCDLLSQERLWAGTESTNSPLLPKQPHFAPKAKAVISLFMNGGASHLDTFDPKPELVKRHLEAPPASLNIQTFFPIPGTFLKSPFTFKKYGQSGIEVSELFSQIAECIDDIAVVRSMHALSNNHTPATLQMMTGFIQPGRPCLGAWSIYGLGTENQNLPAFVVLLDNMGGPMGGSQTWSSGFLSGVYQGTPFRNHGDPIVDLASPKYVESSQQRRRLDFIKTLNQLHLEQNSSDSELNARIASYELAFRMQSEAPDVVDLSKESAETRKLYGMDDPLCEHFGRNCLLARRLVEKGVRFVQLFGGGNALDDSWDAHSNLDKNHRKRATAIDKPVRGLLTDLKARGMLDSTLVVWHTEFGRLPISQSISGRDHSPYGFSVWFAGGGVKGGQVIGATDDFGYRAAVDPHSINDFHATILSLLGLDHTQLTFFHNGRMHRLTDVAGEVIQGVA
ncbi:MAG: DUF1501 domain-containing protein [Terriglobia bacterium]